MPLLRADWLDVVFLHFQVDPNVLQPLVPLKLDMCDGSAYVSLVAFTQRRLRLAAGERWLRGLTAPLADHAFLNVRTYVHSAGVNGIFFLTEWIPNRLACFLGPRMYGLPYKLGTVSYRRSSGRMTGRVKNGNGQLAFDARWKHDACGPAVDGTLDHFLLERYVAFTTRKGILRRFDVGHAPWPISPADVRWRQRGLLDAGGWLEGASLACAHHSAGVRNVSISRPIKFHGN